MTAQESKRLQKKIAMTIAEHQWEDFEGKNPYSNDNMRLAQKIVAVIRFRSKKKKGPK
jgi:hypothetical protein